MDRVSRRARVEAMWVLLAVVAGALWGAWWSDFSWLQGALAGLAWGLVIAGAREIRRRRDAGTRL